MAPLLVRHTDAAPKFVAPGNSSRVLDLAGVRIFATMNPASTGGNRARLPDFAPVRIDGLSPEAGAPARFRLVSRTATELVGTPA